MKWLFYLVHKPNSLELNNSQNLCFTIMKGFLPKETKFVWNVCCPFVCLVINSFCQNIYIHFFIFSIMIIIICIWLGIYSPHKMTELEESSFLPKFGEKRTKNRIF